MCTSQKKNMWMYTSNEYSYVRGPLRECLWARRLRPTLLLHATCVLFGCTRRASCVAASNKKKQKKDTVPKWGLSRQNFLSWPWPNKISRVGGKVRIFGFCTNKQTNKQDEVLVKNTQKINHQLDRFKSPQLMIQVLECWSVIAHLPCENLPTTTCASARTSLFAQAPPTARVSPTIMSARRLVVDWIHYICWNTRDYHYSPRPRPFSLAPSPGLFPRLIHPGNLTRNQSKPVQNFPTNTFFRFFLDSAYIGNERDQPAASGVGQRGQACLALVSCAALTLVG